MSLKEHFVKLSIRDSLTSMGLKRHSKKLLKIVSYQVGFGLQSARVVTNFRFARLTSKITL